jgi:hypothetical protein
MFNLMCRQAQECCQATQCRCGVTSVVVIVNVKFYVNSVILSLSRALSLLVLCTCSQFCLKLT